MTESKRMNEMFLKIASLERRISKLESGLKEHDKVIDPQGWIGEAFEKVYEDVERLEAKLDTNFSQVNGKLDAILQRLTGMSDRG